LACRTFSVCGMIVLVSVVAFLLLLVWPGRLKGRGMYVPLLFSLAFFAMFVPLWVGDRTGPATIMFGVGLAWSLCTVLADVLKK
jgi:hypothetical protein